MSYIKYIRSNVYTYATLMKERNKEDKEIGK